MNLTPASAIRYLIDYIRHKQRSTVGWVKGGCNRENKPKNCAAVGIGLTPEMPIMGCDDRVTDRQADPHPSLFGRHEGLEQFVADLIGKPWTIIDHTNL